MTVSEAQRAHNLEQAFRLLMDQLGSRDVSRAFFCQDAPPFDGTLRTTWKEMCDQGWLEEVELLCRRHCRLTGAGWIEGLWRTRLARDPRFRSQLERLGAALKQYVKGRAADIVADFGELVRDSALPEGFVFNVVESDFWMSAWGRRGASWKERGLLVKVPLNFGMTLIDHSKDIRAQLEELNQELSQYKCSCCGAPINGQGTLPLSERDDGFYVSYACGRYEIDDRVDRPCPSAKFPALEEYELRTAENYGGSALLEAIIAQDPSMKWKCEAHPLGVDSQQFPLPTGYGQSKEEAEQVVVSAYHRLREGWR